MELKLDKPFRLHLDVVATDEHVPSMQIRVSALVLQFGHKFEYQGTMWFDCSAWDMFVAGLTSIDEQAAELLDMGGRFVLQLGMESGTPRISWRLENVDMHGADAAVVYRSAIDADDFSHVRNQFVQFDRWWQ
ncbi:hypothetical protein [Ralstonia pseudosolanacearum]|uniref:hypothetical protein n=1 Tax=Ralstonia pseudosolanacearum TaxID=1310165 RepID=UPI003390F084